MKERTVSQRNFVGAFWGGILGILAFGYLYPVALPFGCFFGVVVGWWYQEIWQSAADSFSRGVAGIRVPRRTRIRRLKVHPVNFACAAKPLAAIIYIGLNALWMVPLWRYLSPLVDDPVSRSSTAPLLFVFCGFFTVVTSLLPAVFLETGGEMPKKWEFVHVWERHIASVPFRLFVTNLVNLLLYEVGILLFMWGALIWFTGIGGIFLLLVVAPISAMVGAVKGMYKISMRSGHWLCFGTTVVVTAFVAWIAHPYLNYSGFLWAVAMFTGLASAIATEGLRCSLAQFFTFNRRVQAMVSTSLSAQLAPGGRAFWRTTEAIGGRVWDALPIPA